MKEITYLIKLFLLWVCPLGFIFYHLYMLFDLKVFIAIVLLHVFLWYLIYLYILSLIPKSLKDKFFWNIIFRINFLIYIIILIFFFYIWFRCLKYSGSIFELTSSILDKYYFDPSTLTFHEYANKEEDISMYFTQLLFYSHLYNIIPVYIYWYLISCWIIIVDNHLYWFICVIILIIFYKRI